MPADAFERALEALSHRERTCAELATWLAERGFEPADVEAALERLIEAGAFAQLTSTSFSGRFGEPARKAAFEMLERGLGHVIASDGHGADGRPPDLTCAREALEARYQAPHDLFDWATTGVPGAIVSGQPPPPRPPTPRRRGLLRRLARNDR